MRRRDFYWSLFHKDEKRQIDDLRTEYIEVVFEVIPLAQRDDWLIWREGFRSWKPLADFPALLISLREHQPANISQPTPPSAKPVDRSGQAKAVPTAAALAPAERSSSKGAKNPAHAAETVVGGAKTVTEQRTSVQTRLERANADSLEAEFAISHESDKSDRDTRYPQKWEVKILGGLRPIINQTVDASNKGLHLRDALPAGLPNYFNVEIRAFDQIIPVICSEIKTPDGSPSKRLRIEVNHHANTLQTLLLT